MNILDAFLMAAAGVALWAGYRAYTPADFEHFEVDHHNNKDGDLRWTQS